MTPIRRIQFEPEYEETVEHDIVIEIRSNGEAVDITEEGDYDPEVRKQQ